MPSIVSHSASISASEKGSRWDQAIALLREMSGRGLEPNLVSHSTSITACDKEQRWTPCLVLLSEMHQITLVPDMFSYSAAFSAYEWDMNLQISGIMAQIRLQLTNGPLRSATKLY